MRSCPRPPHKKTRTHHTEPSVSFTARDDELLFAVAAEMETGDAPSSRRALSPQLATPTLALAFADASARVPERVSRSESSTSDFVEVFPCNEY